MRVLGKDRLHSLRKALQPVNYGDQDIQNNLAALCRRGLLAPAVSA